MNLPVGRAVKYFHELMGQPAPDGAVLISPERWKLRDDLITEEMKELEQAYYDGDLVGFADACADLVYVVVGTAVEAGIPFDDVFNEVHVSNMAKAEHCNACGGTGVEVIHGEPNDVCDKCAGVGRFVRYRADGKVLKPVGWQPPNVAQFIEEQPVQVQEAPPQTKQYDRYLVDTAIELLREVARHFEQLGDEGKSQYNARRAWNAVDCLNKIELEG